MKTSAGSACSFHNVVDDGLKVNRITGLTEGNEWQVIDGVERYGQDAISDLEGEQLLSPWNIRAKANLGAQ